MPGHDHHRPGHRRELPLHGGDPRHRPQRRQDLLQQGGDLESLHGSQVGIFDAVFGGKKLHFFLFFKSKNAIKCYFGTFLNVLS